MMRFSRLFVGAVAASLIASPISAQLLGGGGPIGGVVGGVRNTVGGVVGGVSSGAGDGGTSSGGMLAGTLSNLGNGLNGPGGLLSPNGGLGAVPGALSGSVAGRGENGFTQNALNQIAVPPEISSAPPQTIANYRLARYQALVEANRNTLDFDPYGQPVRKRELIATNPDAGSLAIAGRAGFQVIGVEQDDLLGIRLVTLAIPKGMNVRKALTIVRKAAPALQVDFNHIYEPSGGSLLPVAGAALAGSAPIRRAPIRIVMIDGGVAAHPSLARASIVQQGFAGEPQATGHGTAVGSLLVGEQGPFRGAARGAQLFVGDVYGGNPAAGSVTSILRALSWAASKNPSVINISLVGPNNNALGRAIAALQGRGIKVVAAVGNDGPAAPVQYPASYPGVISVTGVDAQGRALPEAGRAGHLDFAAPGADMIAAFPGQGYAVVRGTSFAAPLAAARLAISGSYDRLSLEARPGKGKIGRGIVCAECRVDPRVLRKK
jgi:hypothetical protein